jgi:hypothetical protein
MRNGSSLVLMIMKFAQAAPKHVPRRHSGEARISLVRRSSFDREVLDSTTELQHT